MAVSAAEKNDCVNIIADPCPDADFSVLLKLPKFSKNVSHEDFLEALAKLVDVEEVKTLGKLKNTNEWQVTFDNAKARDKLFTAGNITVGTKKCVVSPSGDKYVLGRVHWLPAEVKDETIKEILQNFGEVIHIAKEKISPDLNAPNSLIRFFILNLSKQCTRADVPHYIFINHYQGLVIVKGRDPMCLECDAIGHRKFECPVRKQKMAVQMKARIKEVPAVSHIPDAGHRSNTVNKAISTISSVSKSKNSKPNQVASVSTSRARRTSSLSDAMQNLIITNVDREKKNLSADAGRSASAATNLPGPSTVAPSETSSAEGGRKKRKRKKKKGTTSDTYNLISSEANSNDTSGSGQHSPKGSLDSGIAVNGNSTSVNVSDSVSELPNNQWDASVQVNESEAGSNVNTTSASSNLNQKKKKKNKKKTGGSQIPGLTHP